MKLYRSPEYPNHWIGTDAEGALVRWPMEPSGWAKRTPYTGGKRQLEEVLPALARGTRWPGAGRSRRPRDPAGKPSDAQIGIRATQEERATWQRASEAREKTLAAWVRDELNAAATRTLAELADSRSRSKKP
ncbi:MAG TPA: hypothetical protein VNO30_16540 [Kofleriaceae bacterium]|nr:hypothetical protein [Kofleriaceae bacterium]